VKLVCLLLAASACAGYDVANFSSHHITVYGCLDLDVETSVSLASFTFGLGYRHR
jgi:hypothetical protein